MITCLRPNPRRTAAPARGGALSTLGLTRCLGAAILLVALTASAQGQNSVTLAWNPSPDSAIAGYRLYQGVASRTYTNKINTGSVTTGTVSNLVSGATYFFAVTAYDTNGSESAFSSEVIYTVPASPTPGPSPGPNPGPDPGPAPTPAPAVGSGLTFAADSGAIKDPFVVANGTLSQPVETTVANGGRTVYGFSILRAGNYLVSALVSAPNEGQNSFYVNIDAEPADPLMIWDFQSARNSPVTPSPGEEMANLTPPRRSIGQRSSPCPPALINSSFEAGKRTPAWAPSASSRRLPHSKSTPRRADQWFCPAQVRPVRCIMSWPLRT